MNWLVLILAFLPFCFGVHEVTEEICANIGNSYPINFTSLFNGSTLTVCSRYLQDELQCCSQSDENVLGMRLNNAISLGSELRVLQGNYGNLIRALSNVQSSMINDVLRPLMNYSIDRTNTFQPFDSLDRIRDEVLGNIDSTIQGTMNANLTEEIIRYFIEGISAYYVNRTFNIGAGRTVTLSPADRTCAKNAIYQHLFPPVEQEKIVSLGNNLQQIAVAFEVARAVISSMERILTKLQNFEGTSTCTNVWTQQYACPLCAGQTTPLCEGRCNEVLIGCMSSLQQVIVQLNVLLDFTRASVSSLINGDPYDSININNIGDLYISTFETSLNNIDLLDGVINDRNGANCEIGSKKRSVDSHHKRQTNVMFPTVNISQSIVTMINDQLLPTVMNVSLDSDRIALCNSVMANGSDVNCTLGVGNISPYISTFDRLEISDQEDNPTGTFNLAQLRGQARPLTYAVTDLLTNRSDIMMLYESVLPGRDFPNLDFLTAPTPTISMSVTPTASDMPGPTQSDGTSTVSLSSFITETTATPSTAIAPSSTVVMTRPTETGGATAVPFSMFITLAALLFTSVFVD